jgi:formamidopyrimidine-DNA glycosylase
LKLLIGYLMMVSMPELPEVQTIVNDLKPLLPGLVVVQASYIGKLGQELLRKSRVDLSLSLSGKRIVDVRRLAKQVVMDLDSGEYLLFHLKITGRLLLRDRTHSIDEYTRLVIKLSDGQELRFTDRNGLADAYLTINSELDQITSRYGPEALDEKLSAERFHEMVAGSSESTVKETLLNQKIVSGVGNIYADEALILAKIHPSFRAKQVTEEQSGLLLDAVRQVLNEGLVDRGTTIDSYVDPFGSPGKHQEKLRAYGRIGKPCLVCGAAIEYTEVGGRRTFFCPNCQSLPQLSLF